MELQKILKRATAILKTKSRHTFDQLEITKPKTQFEALNLLKITSKLSPIIGNLFEIDAVEALTQASEFKHDGTWIRQDPGFPDLLYKTGATIEAGFEVKAWYPFATEITGRFKDSQRRFSSDQTHVLMFAWVPDHMLFGKPKLLDMCIVSAHSISKARDEHYHNPPDYLVIEPLDTTARTRNLQQTNTSGYKFQGTAEEMEQARKLVAKWGKDGNRYASTLEYQQRVHELQGRFRYRLDTNYAKMDRVVHEGLETFKTKVMNTNIEGRSIAEWSRLFRAGKTALAAELEARFKIKASRTGPSLASAPEPSSPSSQSSEADDE